MPFPPTDAAKLEAAYEHTLSLQAAIDSMRRKYHAGLANEAMTARDPIVLLANRVAAIVAALPAFVP